MLTGALVPRRGTVAGVPGPRRSADECDAGWFAPVATRRRSNSAACRLPGLAEPDARHRHHPRAHDRDDLDDWPEQGHNAWNVAIVAPRAAWH